MPFRSFASERFWQLYTELPAEVQRLADKQYELFREDPYSLAPPQAGRGGLDGAHRPFPPGDRLPRRGHILLGLDWLPRGV